VVEKDQPDGVFGTKLTQGNDDAYISHSAANGNQITEGIQAVPIIGYDPANSGDGSDKGDQRTTIGGFFEEQNSDQEGPNGGRVL